MLDFIATYQSTIIGVIFMLVIGPAVGNYACSVVYRLPRGKTPFERYPFCGHCNADLKPIDLFPILSWLMTRGKCRYCGEKIPGIYTVIEVACGLVFVSYFLRYGVDERFLLYTAYATFVIILASIQWLHGWISVSIYSYAFLMILLLRALLEQTIFTALHSSFVILVAALILWRISSARKHSPFDQPWIWWLVLIGVVVPLRTWVLMAPVVLLSLIVPRSWRVLVYAGSALLLPLFL